MKNGRKHDVLILDEKYTDPRTGVEVINNLCFEVWADAEKKSAIEAVEGVNWVFQEPSAKTHFKVYYDQRYEREYLKREVEAAVLCSEGG